jgi:hypothetical protein
LLSQIYHYWGTNDSVFISYIQTRMQVNKNDFYILKNNLHALEFFLIRSSYKTFQEI